MPTAIAAFRWLMTTAAPAFGTCGGSPGHRGSEDLLQQTFLQMHTARGRFLRGAAVEP
jgi:hypothetical protein